MTASTPCFQNILLGTDFSDAAAIGLDTAINLAQRRGAKLTVAHVVPEASASFAMIDYGSEAAWMPAADDVKRLQQDLCESAAQRLHVLAAEIKERGVAIETEVLIGIPYESLSEAVKAKGFDLVVAQGRPYQVINSTARRLDAGLVVMGSVGRRGLPALLIGNTAEKVLHTSDRSLLVIKPQATAVRLPEADTAAVALSAAT